MTDDRKLIEDAARAAGIVGVWDDDPFHPEYGHNHEPAIRIDGTPYWWWNPLTDDGDVFRLQVLLDIELYLGEDDGPAMYAGGYSGPRHDIRRSYMIERLDAHGGDRLSAARRALTRAAASMAAKGE